VDAALIGADDVVLLVMEQLVRATWLPLRRNMIRHAEQVVRTVAPVPPIADEGYGRLRGRGVG